MSPAKTIARLVVIFAVSAAVAGADITPTIKTYNGTCSAPFRNNITINLAPEERWASGLTGSRSYTFQSLSNDSFWEVSYGEYFDKNSVSGGFPINSGRCLEYLSTEKCGTTEIGFKCRPYSGSRATNCTGTLTYEDSICPSPPPPSPTPPSSSPATWSSTVLLVFAMLPFCLFL